MDGKMREKQVVSCLLHKEAHSPSRAGMSSPVPFLLPSLISPLRSNSSVPSFTEKEGCIYKDDDGSPVQHVFLIFPFSEKGTDNRGKHKELTRVFKQAR